MILSVSSAWEQVNIFLNISKFSADYKNHIIEVIIFSYHAKIGQKSQWLVAIFQFVSKWVSWYHSMWYHVN